MTLLPTAPRRIGKAEGPEYEIGTLWSRCQAPDCHELWSDRHHVVRRSYAGKDANWISIDGVPHQNIVGLCRAHHHEITENKARIYWDGDEEIKEGEWRWHEGVKPGHGRGSTTWYDVGPLEPALSEGAAVSGPAASSESAEHDCPHITLEPGDKCSCGYRKPHPKTGDSPTTKQLNLGSAPVDAAEEMKQRADGLAERMGLTERKNHRVKVFDIALTLAESVADETLREIAAERPFAA